MTMRRWILTSLLMLACATAWLEPPAHRAVVDGEVARSQLAPGALGTRDGTPIRTATPSGSGYAWLQMTLALVLVAVGLRYGLPRLLGWASKAGIGSRMDGEIRLLESRAVPGGSLLMVKARDRLLLIGTTTQSMHLLADLTEDPTLSHPSKEKPAGSAFEQMLQRMASREASSDGRTRRAIPADLQQEVADALQARIEQARARLSRIASGGG